MVWFTALLVGQFQNESSVPILKNLASYNQSFIFTGLDWQSRCCKTEFWCGLSWYPQLPGRLYEHCFGANWGIRKWSIEKEIRRRFHQRKQCSLYLSSKEESMISSEMYSVLALVAIFPVFLGKKNLLLYTVQLF